jgi:hypothetical protein
VDNSILVAEIGTENQVLGLRAVVHNPSIPRTSEYDVAVDEL